MGAEDWIVRAAQERGFLPADRLEAARREHAARPHAGGVLGLLRERYLSADQVQALQRAWQLAQSSERALASLVATPTSGERAPPSPAASEGTFVLPPPPGSLPPAGSGEGLRPARSTSGERPADGAPRVGPFELVRELARGGMGVVWVARRTGLDRQVALKQLLPADGPPPAALVQRFLDEARLASRLQHPNIVRIHEVGQENGLPWFAMDLVEGESLLGRIRRQGALPGRDAAGLFARLARALAYAHTQRVLHRDLKPHNVLLNREGEPFLTDFGLAKAVDEDGAKEGLTRQGEVMGTPTYMPPEQAEGAHDRIDQRADVYSLGATLYEALTGKPPFAARNVIGILHQVMTVEPISPRQEVPTLDRDLETIVLRCLEKEPLQRYPSATALAEDLERYLRDEPILARAPTRGERVARWVRRNRATAGVLLGASLVVLAIGAGAGVMALRARTAERARLLAQAHTEADAAWSALEAGRAAGLDERVGLALRALQTADRCYALDPAAGAAVRYRAARALGEVAAEGQQWPLAAEAWRLAAGLGVDDAGAAAAIAAVESARVAEDQRRLSEVRDLLDQAARGALRDEAALEDAAHKIGRYPQPAVLALCVSALDRASDALGRKLRDEYLATATPDEDERSLGEQPLAGVPEALDAWLGPLGSGEAIPAALLPRRDALPAAQRELLGQIERRVLARALRRVNRQGAIGRLTLPVAMEAAQRDVLVGGAAAQADLAVLALARLGLPEAVPALARHLTVAFAPSRAQRVVRALVLVGGPEVDGLLQLATTRYAEDQAFLRRALTLRGQQPARADLSGDALREAGLALFLREPAETVLAWVEEQLRAHPADPGLLEVRAMARHARGDWAGARADAERVLQELPGRSTLRRMALIARAETGDMEGALAEARQFSHSHPQDPIAWNALGKILLRRGEQQEARDALEQALVLAPDDPDTLTELSTLLTDLGAPREGEQRAVRALELTPDWAQAHYALGWARFHRGDLAGALDCLDRGLRADPHSQVILLARAQIREEAGDLDGALHDVEQLIALRPLPQVLLERARIHAARGAGELARADIERVRKDACLGPVWYQMALVWRDLGEQEQALAALHKALELSPRMALAWKERGTILAQLGRREEALRDLERAVELQPELPGARGNRAILLRDLGREDEALEEMNRLIAAQPDVALGYINRGQMLLMRGDAAGAERDADMAVKLAPQSSGGWVLRAQLRKAQRRTSEAVQDATRAVEVDPRLGYTWLVRGEMRALAGHLDQAEADLTRGLELEPGNAQGFAMRAQLRAKLGRREEAQADLRRARELTPAGSPLMQLLDKLARQLEGAR